MTPRERNLPPFSTSADCSDIRSSSVSADWIVAIKYRACFRIGTAISAHQRPEPEVHSTQCRGLLGIVADPRNLRRCLGRDDLVAEQPFGLLDSALQVPDRVHL